MQNKEVFDIWELSKIHDREGVRVIGEMPVNLKLNQIVGITHYKNGLTKASLRKGKFLYLCVLKTKDFFHQILGVIDEIKNKSYWAQRWEHWELDYDESSNPLKKQARLLRSRLRNDEERKEWELFHG